MGDLERIRELRRENKITDKEELQLELIHKLVIAIGRMAW